MIGRFSTSTIFAATIIGLLVLFHISMAPYGISMNINLISKDEVSDPPTVPKYVLSYSMFGKNSLNQYSKLVTDILKDASKSPLYKNWQVRLYIDQDVAKAQLQTWLSLYPRFVVIDVRKLTEFPNLQSKNGMCWRFLPMGDSKVDIACARDLDTPLLKREETAVEEFLRSNFIFHGMRDNVQHTAAIMGGMWCFRNSKNRELGRSLLKKVIEKSQTRIPGVKEAGKGDDQNVITQIIWPVVKTDSMNHCSFHCDLQPPENTRPFPTKRVGDEFLGCQRWDCHYKLELLRCSDKCKPKEHLDWTYC